MTANNILQPSKKLGLTHATRNGQILGSICDHRSAMPLTGQYRSRFEKLLELLIRHGIREEWR